MKPWCTAPLDTSNFPSYEVRPINTKLLLRYLTKGERVTVPIDDFRKLIFRPREDGVLNVDSFVAAEAISDLVLEGSDVPTTVRLEANGVCLWKGEVGPNPVPVGCVGPDDCLLVGPSFTTFTHIRFVCSGAHPRPQLSFTPWFPSSEEDEAQEMSQFAFYSVPPDQEAFRITYSGGMVRMIRRDRSSAGEMIPEWEIEPFKLQEIARIGPSKDPTKKVITLTLPPQTGWDYAEGIVASLLRPALSEGWSYTGRFVWKVIESELVDEIKKSLGGRITYSVDPYSRYSEEDRACSLEASSEATDDLYDLYLEVAGLTPGSDVYERFERVLDVIRANPKGAER